MKALLLTLLISFSTYGVPIELSSYQSGQLRSFSETIRKPSPQEIYNQCNRPDDLINSAKALLRRYFSSNMYNSVLFDKFLWLHPEHEDFITCLICRSGRPSDPYWEMDFVRMCLERNGQEVILVDERNPQTDSAFL